MDGTIKLWEVYSGKLLQSYDEHGSAVQRVAMNSNYMASYSDQNNLLIVRDINKGIPLFKLSNMEEVIGFTVSQRDTSNKFEIGDIVMPYQDPFMMITSESKRIRVWDLRKSLEYGSV